MSWNLRHARIAAITTYGPARPRALAASSGGERGVDPPVERATRPAMHLERQHAASHRASIERSATSSTSASSWAMARQVIGAVVADELAAMAAADAEARDALRAISAP